MNSKINKFVVLLPLFCTVICTIISPVAFAINVIPFSGTLDLTQKSSYTIKVTNPTDAETAVKMSVYKWTIDKQGKEIRTPSNDLILFPRQMLIAASSSRSVRISLREGVPPTFEKSYRIIVEQLPLKSKASKNSEKGASINVLTRYVTAFYVTPAKPASKIKVTKISAIEQGFALDLKNIGNAHTHFIQPEMTIMQDKNVIIIDSLQALDAFARTNLLASGFRSYQWQIPEEYKQEIDFNKAYHVNLKWRCENCEHKIDQLDFTVQ